MVNVRHNYLFSPMMKMADIILANNSLLSVLQRFEIPLGFGDKTLSEVCEINKVDETLFILVCNIYTFSDYLPDTRDLEALNINKLVDYLSKSHAYYRNDRIYSIEQRLESMDSFCQGSNIRILKRFFDEYKSEIIKHFEYEETTVFPYINSLMQKKQDLQFHIDQYEENHSNIEDKLSDLKNIIIKYLPSDCAQQERIGILNEICLFEEDLGKHSIMEDKILVPLVEKIEKSYDFR